MKRLNAADFARAFAMAVAITMSMNGLAEQSTATAGTVSTTAPAPSESKVFGTLDLRAEYYSSKAQYDTSNFAQLGYQFTKDVKVSWYQGFDSQLYNSGYVNDFGPAGGSNFMMDQGFLRTQVNNIWTNGQYSFNYESRVYVPTLSYDARQGNITRLYNAFKLKDKINDTVTLTAVEVVAPQIFSVAGVGTTANPWYENRVYLIADFNITSKLSLEIPLLLYTDFNRNYAGAKNSGLTTNILYTWPELDYALNDTLTLGVAFVTDNMVKADFSDLTLGDAFKNGIAQFVFTANL